MVKMRVKCMNYKIKLKSNDKSNKKILKVTSDEKKNLVKKYKNIVFLENVIGTPYLCYKIIKSNIIKEDTIICFGKIKFNNSNDGKYSKKYNNIFVLITLEKLKKIYNKFLEIYGDEYIKDYLNIIKILNYTYAIQYDEIRNEVTFLSSILLRKYKSSFIISENNDVIFLDDISKIMYIHETSTFNLERFAIA